MKEIPLLGVGCEDFEKLMEKKNYYVDKTMFIKHVKDQGSPVQLYTRPRRFGKTLMLSMAKCFFQDMGTKEENLKRRQLFDGLNIMSAGDKYLSLMNTRQVIFVSFSKLNRSNLEDTMIMLKQLIANLYTSFAHLSEKINAEPQREIFERLRQGNPEDGEIMMSLFFLSKIIYMTTGQKSVILIDEYDVPLQTAFTYNYYTEMLEIIRPMLSDALKSNRFLDFALICGCLRIAETSKFHGLNNWVAYSILHPNAGSYFGFTESEVKKMLEDFQLEDMFDEAKEWYKGYLIGNTEIYNPWSICNMVESNFDDLNQRTSEKFFPLAWANSSGNLLARNLIIKYWQKEKANLDALMSGSSISVPVSQTQAFGDAYSNSKDLWSILLFTGYLKPIHYKSEGVFELMIPNKEVLTIYRDIIKEWFNTHLKSNHKEVLLQALLRDDAQALQKEISLVLMRCISFWDSSAEEFYHGFMLATLDWLDECTVSSNRGKGDGRPDITLIFDESGKVCFFELQADKRTSIESQLKEGSEQIIDNNYVDGALAENASSVVAYALAFQKKTCVAKIVASAP
ncbi:MAG: ATP-binding protein [Clostridiales bacterium]|jgi:hypothetical protein|nr:ATP-binding protein [Clostridiales bacterium]